MTEAIICIKQWGNNLGIRLPAANASEAHLKLNQRVRISVEDDFTPINDAPLTLEQRLSSFHLTRRHYGEVC